MSAGSESGATWVCPQCSRRVPIRVDACRCGGLRQTSQAELNPSAAAGSGRSAAPGDPARFNEDLRSPREQTLFFVGAAFSAIVWLLLIFSVVGIFYGLVGVIFSLIAHALFLAHVRGNGLRISEQQLPEIHQAGQRAAEQPPSDRGLARGQDHVGLLGVWVVGVRPRVMAAAGPGAVRG